ncbi:MAG: polymerase [Herbinix sp.]|nr:polymerase [Herbinix sp.]
MHYIIYDFEFNQDFSSLQDAELLQKLAQAPQTSKKGLSQYPFEIIQIGAVKLDTTLATTAEFNHYIKPLIYTNIHPQITELTGITTEQLDTKDTFPVVYQAFLEFMEDADSILCTWGMSDIRALFKNAEYHHLDTGKIPRMYINIQPYVSSHFNKSQKMLLRLQTSVELLGIPISYTFHNALHDAYYTAEIFKKLFIPSLQPRLYQPNHIVQRPRHQKKKIHFDKLIRQIEKMYARPMSEEEQEIIKLAYKMGKTNQFLE